MMRSRDRSSSKNTSKSQSKRLPNFRPSSAAAGRKQYLLNMKVSNSTDCPPPIIFTMPNNNQKRLSGMGNNLNREQLYENNMQLKNILNKLKRELAATKYQVVKKDIELREKEKIIKDCSKENDIEIVHQNNLEKAKESALLTTCKEKYYTMKDKYTKKCEENEVLKANIKITKIKEFETENDELLKELDKLKILYQNSIIDNENSKKEIKELQEFKSQFLQQHAIINSYIRKCENYEKNINDLKEKNENLQNEIDKILKKQQKLKILNSKLKIYNEKYMNQKKMNEVYSFNNTDNLKKIADLKKEVEDLEKSEGAKEKKNRELKKKNDIIRKNIEKLTSNVLKPYNYKKEKPTEIENNYEGSEKIELYKSLIDDYKMRNVIFENYIKKQKKNPQQIIKDYEKQQIIAPIKLLNKPLNKIEEDEKEYSNTDNNINNGNNIDNNLEKNNKISIPQSKPPNSNEEKNTTENNINNNNDEYNNQIQEKAEEEDSQLLALFHLFVKNMESNHITQEILETKINGIFTSFGEKTEATKEEFLEPFVKMFIELMKITKETDKEVIKTFFSNYIDRLNGDTNVFYSELIDIFKNIQDYSSLGNEEAILNLLAGQLQNYKDKLEIALNKEDINKDHIITFDILRKIIQENNIILDDDLMEYLIYKMKVTLPAGKSMFDLNAEIILDLLKKEVQKVEEEDPLSAEISQKLSDFKSNLINNKTDFENTYKEFVQTIQKDNKTFNVLEKDKFFEIMEKYNVTVSEEVKAAIYELFKADPDAFKDNKIELMDFEKLKQLFINDFYSE